MKLKNLTLAVSMIVGAMAFAGVQELPALSANDAAINVAQVQASFVIKKPDAHSQSRISLIVKDLGGATDVSPTLGLYLIFWKDGEWGNATASFDLGNTFSLVDYNDTTNGKIVMKLKEYGEHGFQVNTVTVDYSEFAAKFERESAIVPAEYQENWVQGSVYLK